MRRVGRKRTRTKTCVDVVQPQWESQATTPFKPDTCNMAESTPILRYSYYIRTQLNLRVAWDVSRVNHHVQPRLKHEILDGCSRWQQITAQTKNS